jgi:hypothetical protein
VLLYYTEGGVSLMQRSSFRGGILVVCGELEFTCSQFLLLLYIMDNNQELVYIYISSGAKGVVILETEY